LWIGASDTSKEGTFIWDDSGKALTPGYQGWLPGHPYSSCGNSTADCAAYNISSSLPAWGDFPCTSSYGGVCELQPANNASSRSIQQPGDSIIIDSISRL